jgi:hypothetical protein
MSTGWAEAHIFLDLYVALKRRSSTLLHGVHSYALMKG